ncbi:V-set and immunoglobulin domain-containing protein 2 [Heteronotia binoei]|uniref:V-set and immunoglobulin domain-containing protein 2 n=1 Tax=Heteronotia binoei TaxID=13085 RepID=UPI00292E14DC|nr:V-set and immunoglobulin domain-containing protein 2 [Heteronotia binoei]
MALDSVAFFWLLLAFISLWDREACVEVTVPSDPVMQQKSLSAELPCHYKTSVDKNFVLEWKFAPGSASSDNAKQQILYFTNNKLYKPGSQAERLSLLHNPPTLGDASLRLDNVHASDAGTYFCEVNDPPDFYGTGSGLIHFVVLLPPSSPVCGGTAYASVGSDASLTCSSSEGVPAPIYTWTRVDPKTPLPLSNMVKNEQTGSLLLTNISQEFSGTYQCVASNEYGQESCQISLHVTGITQAGTIAGAVIGVLLALLLIGAIVICFLRHKKQQKQKKKTQSIYSGNEIREDATAPGISEDSLERRGSRSESHLLEKLPSRPGSASTTKSQLQNILV